MIDPRIKKAKNYTQNHIKERITLEKASEIANLSRNYFSSLFKEQIGISFSRYQKLARTKIAKELLRKGTLSDKEISYELGFRHVSSFCREFREMTCLTPSAYKIRFRRFRIFHHMTRVIVRIANPIVRFGNKI